MLPAREELHSISQILHLAHHRNHNQHRLAKWYKSFNLLRRHVSKLSSELDTNIQYTALSAKAKKTIESREIVEARVAFLQDVLMERCYLAFSQLVADNQYAVLGLMLLGCLARLRNVIQPLGAEKDDLIEEEDIRVENAPALDFGEVVKRDEMPIEETKQEATTTDDREEHTGLLKKPKKKKRPVEKETKEPTVEEPTPTKRPKKKRKKGDAFDDLFAGLV